LGVIVVGRSEARSVVRCRTTLLFLSTLKSARNFAFASWISCSWRSSNRSCSSVSKVSHVGVMILLVKTSELSFEPAIEGRFDASIFAFPSGVAKKYVDAFLERQTPNKNRGGALWSGADGPRPGVGARVSCLTTGRSAPWGWTVRACAGAAEDRRRRLDLAPGRDPVGEERSYELSRLGPADLDSSNRRRVEERRRIWGSIG
jgi:hypothetical protein